MARYVRLLANSFSYLPSHFSQVQQTQQTQQTPQTFGIPSLRHFWDPNTTSHAKIAEVYRHGPDYNYEDVVWHAWAAVCYIYFPQEALSPTDPRWAIDREAYRGFENSLSSTKPDLIAIKLTPGPLQQNLPPQFASRDYLWIECKAAIEDNPSGWKRVLVEATTRLQTAHPDRTIFLIVAVGWKCIYFVWDPNGAIIGRPPLFVRSAVSAQTWRIDGRLKGIRNESWINVVTGEIHVSRAMVLDCWTTIQVG